ncbi:MAG: hypothetical protein GIX03_11665 [Candidatus Eremiobacteraeota bacterium]|nr:hypothetical protein [Candidatus Eremiobacteraeota bacterium]MBC5803623.1 hypothetical protein [Candidatus Eremiobacteraeota bacterium]MBC5820647.1 hypothetical protein [Candidatus Eremiobacteraeota bacterium]
MPDFTSLGAALDLRGIVRASRFSVGTGLRARGVPAISMGVATIVLAASAGRALERLATVLPDTAREARESWLVLRGVRLPELPP